ncbi:hypothetical protein LJC07_03965 [Christensenellaceae bacterium OttesenSCG-928-L17]|nr:hypothetical protein [Christensenellaceae bacterium OttesenSCG-928-L17]
MCELCLRSPCADGCPDAPGKYIDEIGTCEHCKNPIYAGDDSYSGEDYVDIGGSYYHYDCLGVRMLLEKLDIMVQEARIDDE